MKLTATCIIVSIFLNSVLYACPTAFLYAIAGQEASIDLPRFEVDDAFIGDMSHIITISNPTSHAVTCPKLIIPLVRNETARHYVIIERILLPTGQPSVTTDSSGSLYARWENIVVGAKQDLIVEIDYHILSFGIHYHISTSSTTDYDRNSDFYKMYTQPEPLIESDNPEILSEAQNLIRDTNSSLERVSEIYDFVITNLHYAIQSEERGALWALENKAGDCSEYSYLFVALCRAAGIPARIQAGFAFHLTNSVTEDGHMWVEYYLMNYGWVPTDPTWRLFNAIDFRHFSSIQSKPEETPYANYVLDSPADSGLSDKQTVSLKPCLSFLNEPPLFGKIASATQKIRQARTTMLVGKIIGSSCIFPSETATAEHELLESKILLQNAVIQPDEMCIDQCLAIAEETTRIVWATVWKTLVMYVGAAMTIVVVVAVFLRRRRPSAPSMVGNAGKAI